MGVMSIRELNANVSRAISLAEAGEIISITRGGKVVATLTASQPVRDAEWWRNFNHARDLMRKGIPLGGGKVTEEEKYGDAPL